MLRTAGNKRPAKNQNQRKNCTTGSVLLTSLVIIAFWITVVFYFYRNQQQKLIALQEEEEKIARSFQRAGAQAAHVLYTLEQEAQHVASPYISAMTEKVHLLQKELLQGEKTENQVDVSEGDPHVHVASESYEGDIHIVFSTDCTFFQDWQTLLVFHSAVEIGQKGRITRIASGCDDQKQKELTELYKTLYPQYYVHFTPDYKSDGKTKKKYDFYNKPYGLQHWLTYAQPPVPAGVVVALIDPDFIFLRPLTLEMKGQANNLFLRGFDPGTMAVPGRIGRGAPAAQLYGLGAPWATKRPSPDFNRSYICGPLSPCASVGMRFAEQHYSVGPPYMVERDDFKRLAKSWTSFVPKVYEGYPDLLAEMYAYAMGAADANLPHFTVEHFMVSNTNVQAEGWPWIDALGDQVCEPPSRDGVYYAGLPMPTFLHYCQFFRAGELGFQKRRIRKDIFKCERPIMQEPSRDLGKVDYKNRDGEIVKLSPKQARRNAFALCTVHRSMNSMLSYYKSRMCAPGQGNLNKTINVVSESYWNG